jgi:uncharacterized protein YcaQ
VLEVAETLGCLQLDPTAAVARSHLLVLRARLGAVAPEVVDELAYGRRVLFEYWAHEASLVCASDVEMHGWAMGRWPWRDGPATRRARAWLEANAPFRAHVLERLAADGPLAMGEIEDRAVVPHRGGWTGEERSVARMIDVLWLRGEVGVSRREGGRRLWDLAERVLPRLEAGAGLSDDEAVERGGAAGAADARRRPGRSPAAALHARAVSGARGGARAPGAPRRDRAVEVAGLGADWWVHADDAEALETHAAAIAAREGFRGRTVLLSPFDNLLCDRARTEALFGFAHRLEIYVPRAARRWGYFVLPILHGDGLIGRMDLAVDRRAGLLQALAVHAEPRAPARRSGDPPRARTAGGVAGRRAGRAARPGGASGRLA